MSNPSIFNETLFLDMLVLETEAFEEKYYTSGIADARYPVPALHLKTIPVFLDGECVAIDIVDIGRDSHWPIVAGFDKD